MLHNSNLVHGDLKMTNAVRFAWHIQLIDLNASATMALAREGNELFNASNYNGS